MSVSSDLVQLLAWTMSLYVLVMFGISAMAQKRVESVEDFVVAGRRLSMPLATATLLATWFGAGTLMTASDEVRARGLQATALDPLGAGLCLLLVGLFFAAPLWKEKLVTLPELFGRRYGRGSELLAAILIIPPYLGWIAAQFIALAGILTLYFGMSPEVGVLLVAFVGIGYTLMGGMWAVTLTDAAQMALIIVGLFVMLFTVLGHMGDGSAVAGFDVLWTKTSVERQTLIPTEDIASLTGWLGILCAGALGNIPSQDVMQRVFSARSASAAKWACIVGGVLYLVLGGVPVILGLAGNVLFTPDQQGGTIALLAGLFLSPGMAVLLVMTLMSVVLSTIDSALLAPGTILARDLLARIPRFRGKELSLVRYSVVIIGLISLGLTWAGESAYNLLASGYELGMVSLMAPLTFAVYGKRGGTAAVWASMLVGTIAWGVHMAFGAETFLGIEGFWLPMGLGCTALSYLAFLVARFEAPKAA
ncbi:MAG: sodium:solute symporter family protein [bacterium]